MSLKRTPSSGAIVREVMHFGSVGMVAFVAGDYAVPPNVAPGATNQITTAMNAITRAIWAVRMQNDGAVVGITAKNRTATGADPTDLVTYEVVKILASDVGFATPIVLGGSTVPFVPAPGSLKATIANTSTTAVKGALAVNDAASGSYLAGDYLIVQAVITKVGGLSVAPGAVDVELEFVEAR